MLYQEKSGNPGFGRKRAQKLELNQNEEKKSVNQF
jgi:hypothetical protein